MHYVDMNEVVFDSTSLAFPGLGNCHGVVYANEYGMFGYHAAGNPQDSAGKAAAFGSFVKNHAQGRGKAVRLYGLCPKNRHPGDAGHKAELKVIADAIGFTGKFWVGRWDMAALGWGTTYVEVQFNQNAVTAIIEDFTRGLRIEGANPAWPNHKYVSQSRTAPGPLGMTSKLTTKSPVTVAVHRHGRAQYLPTSKI